MKVEAREPWAAAGLTAAEYRRIVAELGRAPNPVELGVLGVLWSEHCSYKHSRRTLARLPREGPGVLAGPGGNAGVVDIDPGWPYAVAFRIESHNHPCAVEPVQGAATGVGGIVRDILAAGARPIALLDSLRFGDPREAKSRYLLAGVVEGIGLYGNRIGVPTVGGEVAFDDGYRDNPLCNVLCAGIVPKRYLGRPHQARAGAALLLIGPPTGRDGIHGASFASAQLSEATAEQRPAVQVGDAFAEKLLIEICQELVERDLLLDLQDLGAAGLSSAVSEVAHRSGCGAVLRLEAVPQRAPDMTPYEILLSESQERMLAVVDPRHVPEVEAVAAHWGLPAARVGELTPTGRFEATWRGEPVASLPIPFLVEGAPAADPVPPVPAPATVPLRPAAHARTPAGTGPGAAATGGPARTGDSRPAADPARAGELLLRLLASPNIASKAWVYRQYDFEVGTATVLGPGAADAAVLRLPGTRRGIALATDGNGRYCALDPWQGAALAVAEAARNVVCTGARPVAVTNCLNFGDPNKPGRLRDFGAVVDGMAAACRALGTPVTGGNVSFYNETLDRPIPPTPVVGMLGVLPDVAARLAMGFQQPGDQVVLLGENGPDLGGSELQQLLEGRAAGTPPGLDLERERAVQEACLAAAGAGLLRSAHDCSGGGLAVALAECCIAGGVGARLAVPAGELPWEAVFFGETPSRIVVSVPAERLGELEEICRGAGVPCTLLGEVGGEGLVLEVRERPVRVGLPVAALRQAYEGALPELLGSHATGLGAGAEAV